MESGPTRVLVHSPLTSASVWGRLPDLLRERGWPVVVISVDDDRRPPYAARFIARAAVQMEQLLADRPAVLIGHSGAGPLLAQIGSARRAAHASVVGYVFVDAGLPRTLGSASRLDLMSAEDPDFAIEMAAQLSAGKLFPNWSSDDLVTEVPDRTNRAELLAGLRPRGLDFFREVLPVAEDWPDAPCGFLRTSSAYDTSASVARQRGWPVLRRELGHFAALASPAETADALDELIDLIG